jgi:putative FmdB family regulatory protein
MPTYDYVCDECGHAFEEFQKISDEPLQLCPKCKKKKLRRLFGAGSGILSKGSSSSAPQSPPPCSSGGG